MRVGVSIHMKYGMRDLVIMVDNVFDISQIRYIFFCNIYNHSSKKSLKLRIECDINKILKNIFH